MSKYSSCHERTWLLHPNVFFLLYHHHTNCLAKVVVKHWRYFVFFITNANNFNMELSALVWLVWSSLLLFWSLHFDQQILWHYFCWTFVQSKFVFSLFLLFTCQVTLIKFQKPKKQNIENCWIWCLHTWGKSVIQPDKIWWSKQ